MFLDMVFRSLLRQRTRTFLTGMGIFLAIATIVSLGSFSEGINSLVSEQLKFAGNLISVSEKTETSMVATGPPGLDSKVPREVLDELKQIEGVEDAVPMIMQMDLTTNLFIIGVPLGDTEYFNLQNIDFVEGGWPEEGEMALVLGNTASEMQKLKTGDAVKVNGDEYSVSGVLEGLGNFIDYGAISSVDVVGETFDMEDYYSEINVEPVDVSDSDRIANEIDETYDYLDASTAEESARTAQSAMDTVRMLTLSIGVIASFVASIGIINTMIIIVFERQREFGIMKALGGQRRMILFLVVQESMIIGIVASLMGIAVGVVATYALNSASAFPIAKVTFDLAAISLAYGITLSILAALYPAYLATKVSPVDAMREQ